MSADLRLCTLWASLQVFSRTLPAARWPSAKPPGVDVAGRGLGLDAHDRACLVFAHATAIPPPPGASTYRPYVDRAGQTARADPAALEKRHRSRRRGRSAKSASGRCRLDPTSLGALSISARCSSPAPTARPPSQRQRAPVSPGLLAVVGPGKKVGRRACAGRCGSARFCPVPREESLARSLRTPHPAQPPAPSSPSRSLHITPFTMASRSLPLLRAALRPVVRASPASAARFVAPVAARSAAVSRRAFALSATKFKAVESACPPSFVWACCPWPRARLLRWSAAG